MALENIIVCDRCGKREPTSAPTVWLKLVPSMASHAAAAEFLAAHSDPDDREYIVKTADTGDFCSLLCLGEWALARHNLKELDVEMGGDA